MASGIFAILDDVAMLLDDTAVLTKIAAKKTAGLLGDDLAVNAEKAIGFSASRELHVLWAITKGSILNKIIILPLAFLLSAFLPQLIVPILLLGGAYLSYEGAEKVIEWIFPHAHNNSHNLGDAQHKPVPQQESVKIKAAIRTDFILSIEIVVITLSTVIDQSLPMQVIVVSLIALLATVGVYGLVALLVRMDDTGLHLIAKAKTMQGTFATLTRVTGHKLITTLPYIIRILGVIGTIAMLLVGGGMFVHNIAWIHQLVHSFPALIAELLVGLIVGAILVVVIHQLNTASQTKANH